jgi:hypothetical protein
VKKKEETKQELKKRIDEFKQYPMTTQKDSLWKAPNTNVTFPKQEHEPSEVVTYNLHDLPEEERNRILNLTDRNRVTKKSISFPSMWNQK